MFSLILRNLNLKTLAWGQAALLVVIVLWAFVQHDQLKTQRVELETARTALEHPKTVEVVRTVVKEGPVRIKKVVIEKPGPVIETILVEEREGTTTTTDSKSASEPVPVTAMVSSRSLNRWLFGADLRNLDAKNYEAWTLYGGYSLWNKVDLMAGIGRHERMESHLMAVIRF